MAAIWNAFTSPIKRLSVGVGLLSPDKENMGKSDVASPIRAASPLAPRNQLSIPEPAKAAVAIAAPVLKAAAEGLVSSGAKRESLAVNMKANGAKNKKANNAKPKAKARSTSKPSSVPAKVAKVKSEKLRESLRTKTHKKGFYSQSNLEALVWKGTGSEADPVLVL